MKIRVRFVKKGSMQYIGHLDLMRYFQKLFRRSGFDVAYSQGFNPHQLMSFASPLGLGVTTVADYLDVTLQSFCVKSLTGDERDGEELSSNEWVERINGHSNENILVTGIFVLEDSAKTSMALLNAASYAIRGLDRKEMECLIDYFNKAESIIYYKETKKSVKEINLKDQIIAVCDGFSEYEKATKDLFVRDEKYDREYCSFPDALYLICPSGSENNIKPEMFIEAYYKSEKTEYDKYSFEVVRTDMFYKTDKYISMSVNGMPDGE